jgi:16S rRNA (guanine527-N7)-methyltransferase
MTGSPSDALRAGLDALGLSLRPDAPDRLLRHLALVREANRTTNLTRITDPHEMVRDHVLDALALLVALERAGFDLEPGLSVMDLGSGAGFPGIPIAIARPDLRVSLVDSRGPKARFLETAVADLGLADVSVLGERAREIAARHPQTEHAFGLVTSRAVSRLGDVLREVKRLAAPGGLVAHFKGPALGDDERRDADRAAARHGFAHVADLPTRQAGRDRVFVLHRRK